MQGISQFNRPGDQVLTDSIINPIETCGGNLINIFQSIINFLPIWQVIKRFDGCKFKVSVSQPKKRKFIQKREKYVNQTVICCPIKSNEVNKLYSSLSSFFHHNLHLSLTAKQFLQPTTDERRRRKRRRSRQWVDTPASVHTTSWSNALTRPHHYIPLRTVCPSGSWKSFHMSSYYESFMAGLHFALHLFLLFLISWNFCLFLHSVCTLAHFLSVFLYTLQQKFFGEIKCFIRELPSLNIINHLSACFLDFNSIHSRLEQTFTCLISFPSFIYFTFFSFLMKSPSPM